MFTSPTPRTVEQRLWAAIDMNASLSAVSSQVQEASKDLIRALLCEGGFSVDRSILEPPRKPIPEFAAAMEGKLQENDTKGGRGRWLKRAPQELLSLLRDEVAELDAAILGRKDPVEVLREAADVANFAMMGADAYDAQFGLVMIEKEVA